MWKGRKEEKGKRKTGRKEKRKRKRKERQKRKEKKGRNWSLACFVLFCFVLFVFVCLFVLFCLLFFVCFVFVCFCFFFCLFVCFLFCFVCFFAFLFLFVCFLSLVLLFSFRLATLQVNNKWYLKYVWRKKETTLWFLALGATNPSYAPLRKSPESCPTPGPDRYGYVTDLNAIIFYSGISKGRESAKTKQVGPFSFDIKYYHLIVNKWPICHHDHGKTCFHGGVTTGKILHQNILKQWNKRAIFLNIRIPFASCKVVVCCFLINVSYLLGCGNYRMEGTS